MSEMTADQKALVLDLLQEGQTSQRIADAVGLSRQQVAAIKAHVTMGTYRGNAADEPELAEATETAFRFERNLQSELRQNIGLIERGLRITDGGKEVSLTSGRTDIRAEDAAGKTVVLELKAGTADREAVGQILSYMGDLDVTTPEVRGIMVARDFDPRAVSAARAARRIRLIRYGITFSFTEQPT